MTTIDELTSIEQDWGGKGESDRRGRENPYSPSSDGKDFSRLQIQKFIKDQIGSLRDGKFGHAELVTSAEGSRIDFYSEEGGTVLVSITLSGSYFSIDMGLDVSDIFNILTGEATKVITGTPSTVQTPIGGQPEDYPEGYDWRVEVDSGQGFVLRASGSIAEGGSFSVDVRPWVTLGMNRIRFSVTGQLSETTKSKIVTANVTSLSLRVEHRWERAWIQGLQYAIGGLYIDGSIAKTLHVRVDGREAQHYTRDFTAQEVYRTSPFSFDMTERWPSTALASGIHYAEVWLTGEGVTTPVTRLNLMCVTSSETATARLVVMNDFVSPAVNYEQQRLMRYAVYNAPVIGLTLTGSAGGSSQVLYDDTLEGIVTGQAQDFIYSLEYETELETGVQLSVRMEADGGNTQNQNIAVDNSNAYLPVSGAYFYMKPSGRDNSQEDRETVRNDAAGAAVTGYPGIWDAFAWYRDGWGVDALGRKCLSVEAGSRLSVPTLLPLSEANNGNPLTVELKLRVSNVADYDTPVLTFMNTETYGDTSRGIMVFPTRIAVIGDSTHDIINQSTGLIEDEDMHIALVFYDDYASTHKRLCRIYVNGAPQKVFEFTGGESFGGNAYLRVGQDSADVYVYMMRCYRSALEPQGVVQNWLNAMTGDADTRAALRAANDILDDGGNIDYLLCKGLGLNTLVIETESDQPLPDVEHTYEGTSVKSALTMEFAEHPEWNWRLENAPLEGQGTTSMLYYRWNLRSKNGSSAIWHYADGTTSAKSGWLDGADNHPKVNKITAKKNVASSPQGHKMGCCEMYTELYHALGYDAELPQGARVSVYQYPVVAFHKLQDGTYEFCGLYTIGPDKGDKGTFGYDTDSYPSMLSLEGPNHDRRGTLFNHPWTDVSLAGGETLQFGGQEAWDIDTMDDDTISTDEGKLALLAAEWKPAYELPFFCSPYLASLADAGYGSLEALNADKDSFMAGSDLFADREDGTRGRRNSMATLYDSEYNLIYFRWKTQQYEVLQGHSMLQYLSAYLSGDTPSTDELVEARKAKFAAEAADYWNITSACYHSCFCEITGAKDNDAKNTYPFKLTTLQSGGRWAWRQDDLDSIGPFDNNGNTTVSYWVEFGDKYASGGDVFQGSSSIFWTLMRDVFADRMRTVMTAMLTKLTEMAASHAEITASSQWGRILGMIGYYLWSRSARYFPALAYDGDAYFAYIWVWQYHNRPYNNVYPLTQALGTQYESEMQWFTRRVIYVMSKYSLGAFAADTEDGLGILEFTPATNFTMTLTPAVACYPKGNSSNSPVTDTVPARVMEDEQAELSMLSSGETGFKVKSLDLLTSLGDLSGLSISSRGGGAVTFTVSGKRLRSLKLGDAVADNVAFNATQLNVGDNPCLESLDVRNVSTLSGQLDLSGSRRLRTLLMAGCAVGSVELARGAKMETLSLPAGVTKILLQDHPMLTEEGLTIPAEALGNIEDLFVGGCQHLEPLSMLRSVMDAEDSSLAFVTLDFGQSEGEAADIQRLERLTEERTETSGYGRVEYSEESGAYTRNSDRLPDLRGSLAVDLALWQHKPAVQHINQVFAPYFSINVAEYLDCIYIDQTGVSSPTGMIGSLHHGDMVSRIRQASHRYLGKFVSDGDGGGKMLVCQLNDNDSRYFADGTPALLDGTYGDVFMKLPRFHYRMTQPNPNMDRWKFDLLFGQTPEGDGWQTWDGDRKLIGVYEAMLYGGKLYSRSGVASAANATQSTFRSYARARNIPGSGVDNFHIGTWDWHCMMAMLFYSQYLTLDSQGKCGSGTDSSSKATGQTDDLGMRDTDTVRGNAQSINFWGLENWWGNKWEWIDNVAVVDGVWNITDIPSGETRQGAGASSPATGGEQYIKAMHFGPLCDLISKTVGGSSTTFFCDVAKSNPGSRVTGRSGHNSSAACGVASVCADALPSNHNTNTGARLAFDGQVEEAESVAAFIAAEPIG